MCLKTPEKRIHVSVRTSYRLTSVNDLRVYFQRTVNRLAEELLGVMSIIENLRKSSLSEIALSLYYHYKTITTWNLCELPEKQYSVVSHAHYIVIIVRNRTLIRPRKCIHKMVIPERLRITFKYRLTICVYFHHTEVATAHTRLYTHDGVCFMYFYMFFLDNLMLV